jgi:cytochrome c biogenesis protein CcdA
MIDSLIARLAEGTVFAPLVAFGVGVLLSLSPVALPSLSVVVSSLAPRTVDADGRRRRRLLVAATPSVVAFVAGMDGALGLVSYFVVEVLGAARPAGPIVISLGAATALVAGPGYALVVLGAFVAGRAVTLLATVGLGARLLPSGAAGGGLAWRRLDLVVGVLFVAAGAYYLFRVLNGDVTTSLPGEPGGGVLP